MSEPICPLLEEFLAYRLVNLIAECLLERDEDMAIRDAIINFNNSERVVNGKADS